MCLHGFTGTPFEIRPVADDLERLGYRVAAPLLAGHGADLRTLEVTGWRDWLASAEAAFDALAAGGSGRVAIVGFSMGGLLALRLAQTRPERVAALAVLAVPFRLRTAQERGIRMLGRLPRLLRRGPLRTVPKLFGSNVEDIEVRRANPAHRAMPFLCLQSLLELMANVREELPKIQTSALVAHGRRDRTVPIARSFELADRLSALTGNAAATGGVVAAGDGVAASGAEASGGMGGAKPLPAATVERLWLDRSCHLVGLDIERDILCAAIARFFSERARW